MKRIITSALAILLACAMVFLCSCAGETKTEKDAEEEASAKVVWSDKTEVTKEMYSYFLNAYFRSFVTTYKSSLSYLGINTEQDLKEQYYDEENQQSWYSYITVQAYGELTELIAIYDEANEIGYEITDSGKEIINTTVEKYESDAEGYGKTIDELYEAMFGEGVTGEIVRKCLEIQTVASEYYTYVYETPEYTDEEAETYFNENRNSLSYFDAITMVVPSDEDAEALLACTDADSFIATAREIITNNNFDGDYETYKDQIESILSKKTSTRNSYNEDNEFVVWAFEEGRAPYDTWSNKDETTGKTTVEMVLPGENDATAVVYRDEAAVRNIVYALITDADEAKAEYDAWVAEGATEDGLNTAIEKYDGGEAININRGSFGGEIKAWLFDENNTVGAHTMITVEGTGTYLMYLLENGSAAWTVDSKKALESEAYQASLDELCEKHPVEYDSEIIYDIPIMTFQTASDTDAAA